ncbi:MAG: hydroxyacid dehydrogenase [Dysosmobacter sp.]|nr:hydroxyacid dehydrogenase [Dysosmobacter sp.]
MNTGPSPEGAAGKQSTFRKTVFFVRYKLLTTKHIENYGRDYLADHDVEVIVSQYDNEEGWIREMRDHQVDAVYCRVDRITPAMMDASPNLKVIAKQGAGLDNIDLDYATQKKIQVVYSPQGNMRTVAEHVVTLVLMCAQRTRYVDNEMRKGNFNVRYTLTGTHDLYGHTVGFIGCGRIGQTAASILTNGFGMRAIAYDPYLKPDALKAPIELRATQEEVFREADYVSLHMQSLPSTRRSIGYEQFKLMKPTAHFINCARGDLIIEEDLVRALKEKKLAGAGLDVFVQEPLPLDHPFLTMENIVLTPHMGAATEDATYRCTMTSCEEVVQVLNGQPVEFPANKID